MGVTVLMGGNEFRASCRSMDEWLLRHAKSSPSVVILPTAAAHENPQMAAANGIRYFQSLGAQASAAMVVTRNDAEEPGIIAPLHQADIIYLTGGSPTYLLDTLCESSAWTAILERWQAGAMVIGSSAGAMVMGTYMHAGGALVPALGLAPRVVVLPHHRAREGASPPAWLISREDPLMALGIPEATACYSDNAGRWQVIGAGNVVVYSAAEARTYRAGDTFQTSQGQTTHGAGFVRQGSST